MLHTWSLAVEEQFYIGLPILLILVHRYAKSALKPILLGCAIASLALCIWFQALRPSATFFLSPFRAWELLVGSLSAIGILPTISNRMLREALAAAAFVMMLGTLWWTSAGVSFPGWQAVFPVFASAILLHIGRSGETRVHRLLAWQPLVWIGLVSYSLYLWHWPLLVYARYHNGMEPLPSSLKYFLLLMALLLAWMSYRWVETPFRRSKAATIPNLRRPVFVGAVGTMAAIGCLAVVAKANEGWERRFSADVVKFDRARSPIIPYQICDGATISIANTDCTVGHGSDYKPILLWGDSHALAWAPAFETFSRKKKAAGVLAINSACPPLLRVNNPVNRACAMANQQVLKWIKLERPDQIYLVASWMSYSQPDGQYSLFDDAGNQGNALVFSPAMRHTIELLRPFVRQIILIGPTPGAPGDVPFKLALSKLRAVVPPPPKARAEFLGQSKWFWQEANRYRGDRQVVLVDPAAWFCDARFCRYQERNGELLYRDGGHLSLAGARYVERHFPAQLFLASPLGEEGQSRGSP